MDFFAHDEDLGFDAPSPVKAVHMDDGVVPIFHNDNQHNHQPHRTLPPLMPPHLPSFPELAELDGARDQIAARVGQWVESITLPADLSPHPDVPEIEMGVFVENVARLTRTEKRVAAAEDRQEVVVAVAAILIRRLLDMNPGLSLTSVNAHRLVFTAMLIAHKLCHDVPYSNSHWSKISGLYDLRSLNTMESEFLLLISFDLSVSMDQVKAVVTASL
jgi:hypothetical protein